MNGVFVTMCDNTGFPNMDYSWEIYNYLTNVNTSTEPLKTVILCRCSIFYVSDGHYRLFRNLFSIVYYFLMVCLQIQLSMIKNDTILNSTD